MTSSYQVGNALQALITMGALAGDESHVGKAESDVDDPTPTPLSCMIEETEDGELVVEALMMNIPPVVLLITTGDPHGISHDVTRPGFRVGKDGGAWSDHGVSC